MEKKKIGIIVTLIMWGCKYNKIVRITGKGKK